MQVSPPQSQRQLVSGKVGWGWRQATYPISSNFGLTGLMMCLGVAYQILTYGDIRDFLDDQSLAWLTTNLNLLIVSLTICGWFLGIPATQQILRICRQNAAYQFSRIQLMAIAIYWLILVAGLYQLPKYSNSDRLVTLLVALWWIIPATLFVSISACLVWRSSQARSESKHLVKEPLSNLALNIVTYSDHTVLVSPSPLGQQPRQFNGLVLMVFSFFVWTMLDIATNFRAILAISLAMAGLAGFFVWQVQMQAPKQSMLLQFGGIWGMGARYTINLRHFSRLSIIKLQEASGDLSWMQLEGNSGELTLPLAMTMHWHNLKSAVVKEPLLEEQKPQSNLGIDSEIDDQLGQTIRQEFHLARQEGERDSLGLANVLLPQGAGILVGSILLSIGCLVLLIFPIADQLSPWSAIALLSVCLLSPRLGRLIFKLVAPNALDEDLSDRAEIITNCQPWEIAVALLIMVMAMTIPEPSQSQEFLPWLSLFLGWLSIAVGICVLAFVRRTPLWHKN
ncbi:MAG: hypothetical protein NW214_05780 [Pseudanabaenaceae cyanobacterium bins.39]|nr:hypothetical protein [Pseudanabaenaceae cyanobacterium bins.39]